MPPKKRNIVNLIQGLRFSKSLPKVDAIIYFDNDVELITEWILNPIGLKSIIVRNPLRIIINLKNWNIR